MLACLLSNCRVVAALVLQGALWAMFGIKPLQGVEGDWSAAAPVALVVCAVSQAAYSAASFKVGGIC